MAARRPSRGGSIPQAIGGLQSAMGGGFRSDLQNDDEAAGYANEGTRLIANMGPVFDQMWGKAPNPSNRPDLGPDAFRGGRPFVGQSPDYNQDFFQQAQQRIKSQLPQDPFAQVQSAVRGLQRAQGSNKTSGAV